MVKLPPLVVVDDNAELRSALERALRANGRGLIARPETRPRDGEGTTRFFLEIPSDLGFLEPVTDYITKQIEQAWSLPQGVCASLGIALSESLINAIKHGNHGDPSKRVRVRVEVSNVAAQFTVADEGAGFDVHDVPHPRVGENLLKSSGRGVLFIRAIMDETEYNARGNCLTMIKRRASLGKDDAMSPRPADVKL